MKKLRKKTYGTVFFVGFITGALMENISNDQLLKTMKNLLVVEKKLEIQIFECLKLLKKRKLYAHMGYASLAAFCQEYFGMSEDMAWKRSVALKALNASTKLEERFKEGRLGVSHLALIGSKITKANEGKIVEFLVEKEKPRSKRELEGFLSCLTEDGQVTETPQTVTVTLKLDLQTADLLDKALKLAMSGKSGQNKQSDSVKAIVEEFLHRKDPVRKAERNVEKPAPAEDKTAPGRKMRTSAVPAKVRHEVTLRDQGKCTFVSMDGKVCGAQSFLEIDHVKPKACGGENTAENLRILCKTHNHLRSEFMIRRCEARTG